ncbi:helix-turn-helix transcriptional regulator [Streptomyces sp. TR1341]|uniref:helix-turn-helix transcriptional regulator n=1 Tax=Streptomyces TaxID=1883 RepID=UPI000FFE7289|nr:MULTISPECIES: helix-turn-helix transcriptional regulator [Streptomyces]NDK29643.1 helix-turn-helix transcriptional regulator [Streptomyces sp. TR1341]WSI83012.1 helix-turn-helix domain-containing protein [Streptomyces murinus]WSI89880.1 helix-turn-helix domain-containing protein [Streptomyces murinus]
MKMTLGERVRAATAALMHITGESQTDLATALGISQTQISRRQSGNAAWSLTDCEALAAHYGIDVLDLLAGPTQACDTLAPVRRRTPRPAPHPTGPTQETPQ